MRLHSKVRLFLYALTFTGGVIIGGVFASSTLIGLALVVALVIACVTLMMVGRAVRDAAERDGVTSGG